MTVSVNKIKNPFVSLHLAADDYKNLCLTFQKLENILKINIVDVYSLQTILSLLEKIKVFTKFEDQVSAEEIKKFRIRRSFKKENEKPEVSCKSLIVVSSSTIQGQAIENKKELNPMNLDSYAGQMEVKLDELKTKLKKHQRKPQSLLPSFQSMQLESEEETIAKLKSKLKVLCCSHEEKTKEITCLQNKVRVLGIKQESLENKIIELESLKQNISVELNVSLKCIESEGDHQSKQYLEEINNELRFLVLAQSNEIESIKNKLIHTQKTYALYSSFSW